MAQERVGGGLGIRGATQLAGAFGTLGSQAGATPPPAQTNPAVFDTPGIHLYGVERGVVLVTVEQWGGGGMGVSGNTVGGATGGGGGGYAKYTLGGALITPGSVLTVTVGKGRTAFGEEGVDTFVTSPGGAAKVKCAAGFVGGDGGAGGVNTVTAGAGLVVITDTAGSKGDAGVGADGGAGGNAAGSGGDGGAGGVGKGGDGKDGAAPGGGGGGGGQAPGGVQGQGAPAKVVISHA
jgi:hypothetical protein